ncbi:MFS transporter [Pontiellaceae bacterium B12227]|nr:MFS transporter [Pontiellaceae bacterium B12227]
MNSYKTNALLFSLIVAIGGFLFGLDAVLISGTLGFLQEEFALSAMEVGTAASAPALGVLIALPFAGFICDKFGRKAALLLVAALYLVSAAGSAFAPNFTFLVIARFLGGLAFSSITLASMYIGEIAPPSWRGKLVSMTQINIVIGLSGAYFVNHLIFKLAASNYGWVQTLLIDSETWRWMLGSEIPFALLWFFLIFRIPESPYWLTLQGREEDAKTTLRTLLPEAEINPHVQDMQESLAKSDAHHTYLSQLKEIMSRPMRLIFIIGLTMAVAQQATGINAILVYAPTVFQQLGSGDGAFAQAIWIGLTGLVFTAIGLLLVDKLGRRPLILFGLAWIIISLGISSFAFKQARYTLPQEALTEMADTAMAEQLKPLVDVEYESDIAFKQALKDAIGIEQTQQHQNNLIAVSIAMNAGLVLFCILNVVAAFHISVGPLMWVLFSEIFPISVRGFAIPLFAILSSLVNYVVQQFFPWQLENMGMSPIFLCYAITCAIGFVILFFTLKETKNMSIEDIQRALIIKEKA